MQVVTANGFAIPAVGLGTWDLRGRVCVRIVEQALRLGYRHIDTAEKYENEREVGQGVHASGVPRSEVFVTTKIWPNHFAPREFERAVKESVVKLRLSDVNLLLLHWPNPRIPLSETIGALCRMKSIGLTQHIGVSNFTPPLLDQAVKLSPEPLVCNQVEVNPFVAQSETVVASKAHGMAVVAYSPIAKAAAMEHPVLSRIATAHGKSPVQVSLRFLLQQGLAVIPRTSKIERLSENLPVFDFELSSQEMGEIGGIAGDAG
jgi:diketogulonate reductase-like aldo/keto reductase